MNKQSVVIDISYWAIIKVLVVAAALALTIWLRHIILIVFLAFILSAAIEPLLGFLQRYKIPKALSLAMTYIIALGVIALMALIVFPPLVEQLNAFVRNLPDLTSQAVAVIAGSDVDQAAIQDYIQRLTDFLFGRVDDISSSVVQVGLGVITGIVTVITIVVVSFYLVAEKSHLYDGMALMLPKAEYDRVRQVIDNVEQKLGSWLRGQLALGLFIGILTWIGLTILQIPYALPLAIIAALFELIPLIGPLIAAIPAIIIGLTISPAMAIGVSLLYLIIQQLESNLIVPKVMERAVGLNPLFIIIALLSGGALMGIMGALIAVPVAVVVSAVLEDIRAHEMASSKE